MKPGAVMVAIAVIGGGVLLLLRWRRNARIAAREDAADEIQVKPYWEAMKARQAAGETDDESDYIIIENKDDAEALKRMFRDGL